MLARAAARWASSSAPRYIAILAFDAVATVWGLYGALLFRLGGEIPPHYASEAGLAAPLLVFLLIATVVGAAMFVASIAFLIAFHTVSTGGLPRTVTVLEFFFTLSLMAALAKGGTS